MERTIELYRPAMPVMALEQAVERQKQMTAFVKKIMREGTDYGTVPGTDKPTLFKPGAEKLTTFFGLSPRFIPVKETERWGDDGTEPFFYYWFKCQLFRHDLLIGEGDGSCNSHESKYRWRWVSEDALPPGTDKDTLKKRDGATSEFKFAIDAAETTGRYGKPAEYWQRFKDALTDGTARAIQRKTRKGAIYDAWEIDATAYRVPNDDIASQVNTINKMAQKRALVAATLIAVNASEFFTQDLEDRDSNEGWTRIKREPPPEPTPEPEQAKTVATPTMPAPHTDFPENPDIEALSLTDGSFHDAVIAQFPHYKHRNHVTEALTKEVGQGWGQRYSKSYLWEVLKARVEAEPTEMESETGKE